MGYSLRLSSGGRCRGIVVLAGIAMLVGGVQPAHAEPETVNGACLFELRVTPSPATGLLPAATTLGISASGACVANGVQTTGTLNGAVAALAGAWSCAAGVATGSLTLQIDHPSFTVAVNEAVVANAGGLLTIVTHRNEIGAGEFVQLPSTLPDCLQGTPQGPTTWTGVFVF